MIIQTTVCMRIFQQVFGHPPKYHVTIRLGDLNPKFGREDIFTPTIWSESLHQESNVNASRLI